MNVGLEHMKACENQGMIEPVRMKRQLLLLTITGLWIVAVAQGQRLLGGDISLLPSYEEQGTTYYDYNGRPVKPLQFFKQQGWNAIRVRLFVEPKYAPQKHKDEGVCQDFDYVLRLGRRVLQTGLQLLLDLHYSDYWADPSKQTMPHMWQDTRHDDLPDSVYQYTRRTLTALKQKGVVPKLIQVGNETTNGMLWPLGKIEWNHSGTVSDDAAAREQASWDYLCQLYEAGCRACREVCPKSKIIIHTEKTDNWDFTNTYYQQMRRHQVDYDIIGLSYYPMWQGTVENLGKNLDRLAQHFPDKEVMIVETAAYYSHENDVWATPDQYAEFYPITVEGQVQFTRELVTELKRHQNVTGLFWWFPEENGSGNEVTKGWLNRGLFDNHTGRALPAMREFVKFTTPTSYR